MEKQERKMQKTNILKDLRNTTSSFPDRISMGNHPLL